jgi:AcrR family transcriptional regulator
MLFLSMALPHPSIQRIADTMGVNRVQIYRYAKSLEEKGFLIITQRFDERNQQQTNEYDFTPLIEAVTRGIAGT